MEYTDDERNTDNSWIEKVFYRYDVVKDLELKGNQKKSFIYNIRFLT